MIAFITLVAFLLTSIPADLIQASEVAPRSIAKSFTLPPELGTVQNSSHFSGLPTIFHIQDAHCNYRAQRKISEIIGYLNKAYGIDIVNLEGGKGDYDLSIFKAINDNVRREQIADRFAREGLINGAEYFAATNIGKVKLWGVEDDLLYLENLRIYRKSLEHKNEADKYFSTLSRILTNLKIHIYSKELLEFDSKYAQYKAGNLEFKAYVSALLALANNLRIKTGRHTDLTLLDQVIGKESAIDFKRANGERDQLIENLRKALSYKENTELVQNTVAFSSGKLSQISYYRYVHNKAKEVGIDTGVFPEFERYLGYIERFAEIDNSKVMSEVASLELEIKAALFENGTQMELDTLSRNLAIAKNIFNVTLTREDHRYYLSNKPSFSTSRYISFINREAPRYKIDTDLGPEARNIDQYREDISKFYELSMKRDDAFMKNLRFQSPDNRVAIIVTGGFHGENLGELFKNNGMSYVSILPNFRIEDGYKCPYFKLLSGNPYADFIKTSQALGLSVLAIASNLNQLGKQVLSGSGMPLSIATSVNTTSPAPAAPVRDSAVTRLLEWMTPGMSENFRALGVAPIAEELVFRGVLPFATTGFFISALASFGNGWQLAGFIASQASWGIIFTLLHNKTGLSPPRRARKLAAPIFVTVFNGILLPLAGIIFPSILANPLIYLTLSALVHFAVNLSVLTWNVLAFDEYQLGLSAIGDKSGDIDKGTATREPEEKSMTTPEEILKCFMRSPAPLGSEMTVEWKKDIDEDGVFQYYQYLNNGKHSPPSANSLESYFNLLVINILVTTLGIDSARIRESLLWLCLAESSPAPNASPGQIDATEKEFAKLIVLEWADRYPGRSASHELSGILSPIIEKFRRENVDAPWVKRLEHKLGLLEAQEALASDNLTRETPGAAALSDANRKEAENKVLEEFFYKLTNAVSSSVTIDDVIRYRETVTEICYKINSQSSPSRIEAMLDKYFECTRNNTKLEKIILTHSPGYTLALLSAKLKCELGKYDEALDIADYGLRLINMNERYLKDNDRDNAMIVRELKNAELKFLSVKATSEANLSHDPSRALRLADNAYALLVESSKSNKVIVRDIRECKQVESALKLIIDLRLETGDLKVARNVLEEWERLRGRPNVSYNDVSSAMRFHYCAADVYLRGRKQYTDIDPIAKAEYFAEKAAGISPDSDIPRIMSAQIKFEKNDHDGMWEELEKVKGRDLIGTDRPLVVFTILCRARALQLKRDGKADEAARVVQFTRGILSADSERTAGMDIITAGFAVVTDGYEKAIEKIKAIAEARRKDWDIRDGASKTTLAMLEIGKAFEREQETGLLDESGNEYGFVADLEKFFSRGESIMLLAEAEWRWFPKRERERFVEILKLMLQLDPARLSREVRLNIMSFLAIIREPDESPVELIEQLEGFRTDPQDRGRSICGRNDQPTDGSKDPLRKDILALIYKLRKSSPVSDYTWLAGLLFNDRRYDEVLRIADEGIARADSKADLEVCQKLTAYKDAARSAAKGLSFYSQEMFDEASAEYERVEVAMQDNEMRESETFSGSVKNLRLLREAEAQYMADNIEKAIEIARIVDDETGRRFIVRVREFVKARESGKSQAWSYFRNKHPRDRKAVEIQKAADKTNKDTTDAVAGVRAQMEVLNSKLLEGDASDTTIEKSLKFFSDDLHLGLDSNRKWDFLVLAAEEAFKRGLRSGNFHLAMKAIDMGLQLIPETDRLDLRDNLTHLRNRIKVAPLLLRLRNQMEIMDCEIIAENADQSGKSGMPGKGGQSVKKSYGFNVMRKDPANETITISGLHILRPGKPEPVEDCTTEIKIGATFTLNTDAGGGQAKQLFVKVSKIGKDQIEFSLISGGGEMEAFKEMAEGPGTIRPIADPGKLLRLKLLRECVQALERTATNPVYAAPSTGRPLINIALGVSAPLRWNATPDKIVFKDARIAEDPHQKKAVESALDLSSDITLIQGPPGCGKTSVTVELIRQFYEKNLKVLVVTQSNSAVDTIGKQLLGLQSEGDRIKFARVASNNDEVDRALIENWEKRESTLAAMNRGCVVLGTIGGFSNDRFVGRNARYSGNYDVVIVEEAGKATIAETIFPISKAKENGKVILVGDHEQLPPYGIDSEAMKNIIEILTGKTKSREEMARIMSWDRIDEYRTSLFEILWESTPTLFAGVHKHKLMINRRSHPFITRLVSKLFYGGDIEPDPDNTDPVEADTINLIDYTKGKKKYKHDEKVGTSYINIREVNLALQEFDRHINQRKSKDGPYRFNAEDVYVITPHKPQKDLLLEAFEVKAIINDMKNKASDALSEDRLLKLCKALNPKLSSLEAAEEAIGMKEGLARVYDDTQKLSASLEEITQALKKVRGFDVATIPGERTITWQDLHGPRNGKKCFHVGTVDSMQGAENEIVILSLTRSNLRGNIGFLGTSDGLQRLNVGFSRAKQKLTIIGDFTHTLTKAKYIPIDNRSKAEKMRMVMTKKAQDIFNETVEYVNDPQESIGSGGQVGLTLTPTPSSLLGSRPLQALFLSPVLEELFRTFIYHNLPGYPSLLVFAVVFTVAHWFIYWEEFDGRYKAAMGKNWSRPPPLVLKIFVISFLPIVTCGISYYLSLGQPSWQYFFIANLVSHITVNLVTFIPKGMPVTPASLVTPRRLLADKIKVPAQVLAILKKEIKSDWFTNRELINEVWGLLNAKLEKVRQKKLTIEDAIISAKLECKNYKLDKYSRQLFDKELFRMLVLNLLVQGDLGLLGQVLEERNIQLTKHPNNLPHILTQDLIYLVAICSEDPDRVLKMVDLSDSYIEPPWSFMRFLKLRNAVGAKLFSVKTLEKYVSMKIKGLVLPDEWTQLQKIDKDESLLTAIWYLVLIKGHAAGYFEYPDVKESLFVRKSDERVYFMKEYLPLNPADSPFQQHKDRNNPFRELVAYAVGRGIGANTAETVITPDLRTFSALSPTIDPAKLPQRDRKSAESAALVFNVFVRKWDESKRMIQRAAVGDTFVTFDHDQAFNNAYANIKDYTETMQDFTRATGSYWEAKDFDPAVIWQTIRSVQRLDIDELVRSIRPQLSADFSVGEIVIFLKKMQSSIEEDVKEIYLSLTGEELPELVPAAASSVPSISQIGKRAFAEINPDKKLMVTDSAGKTQLIDMRPAGAIDIALIKDYIVGNYGVFQRHLDALLGALSLLEKSPPQLFIFDTLVEDLFGAASPKDGMIAIHKSISDDPVALFHEAAEYLVQSGVLEIDFDSKTRVIRLALVKDRTTIAEMQIRESDIQVFELEAWWDKDRGDIKAELSSQRPHYCLRMLQHGVFMWNDYKLTLKIQEEQKGKRNVIAQPTIKKPVNYVTRPLADPAIIKEGSIDSILVFAPNNKLGESVIDVWPLVSSLRQRFPKAIIYVGTDYPDHYFSGYFDGKVKPIPTEDLRTLKSKPWGQKWAGYSDKEWDGYTFENMKKRLWTKEFVKDKKIDMVFDIYPIAPTFDELSKETYDSGKAPYVFCLESPAKSIYGIKPEFYKAKEIMKASIFKDRNGRVYEVAGFREVLDSVAPDNVVASSGVWKYAIEICHSLGLDVKTEELDVLTPTLKENSSALALLKEWYGRQDAPLEPFDPLKKVFLVNVYAKNNFRILTDEGWALLIKRLLEETDAYLVFTRGGQEETDPMKIDNIIERIGGDWSRMILIPRQDIYPAISDIIGIADWVITPDTGLAHLASGVYDKPIRDIARLSAIHWGLPRQDTAKYIFFDETYENRARWIMKHRPEMVGSFMRNMADTLEFEIVERIIEDAKQMNGQPVNPQLLKGKLAALSVLGRARMDREVLEKFRLPHPDAEQDLVKYIKGYLDALGLSEELIPKIAFVDTAAHIGIDDQGGYGAARFKVKLYQNEPNTYLLVDESVLTRDGDGTMRVRDDVKEFEILHEILGHMFVRSNFPEFARLHRMALESGAETDEVLIAKAVEEVLARLMTLLLYRRMKDVSPGFRNEAIEEKVKALNIDPASVDLLLYAKQIITRILSIDDDINIYKYRRVLENENKAGLVISEVTSMMQKLDMKYLGMAPAEVSDTPEAAILALLNNVRAPGASRIFFVPIKDVNKTPYHTARADIEYAFEQEGFKNIRIIFYDDTETGLEEAVAKEAANPASDIDDPNALALAYVNANKMSKDTVTKHNMTYPRFKWIREDLTDGVPMEELFMHVAFGLPVLDYVKNSSDPEQKQRLMEIIEKLSGNNRKDIDLIKADFDKLFVSGFILILKKITKININKEMHERLRNIRQLLTAA